VWDETEATGSFATLHDLKHPGQKVGRLFAEGLLDLMPKLKYQSKKADGKLQWCAQTPRKIQDTFYGIEEKSGSPKMLDEASQG
jgi:hypothetical protein